LPKTSPTAASRSAIRREAAIAEFSAAFQAATEGFAFEARVKLTVKRLLLAKVG
jgi:hypothetical protein